MRLVLGLMGVCFGLVGALLSFGEIGHVRYVAPDALPDWTQGIASGSGLARGRMAIGSESLPLGQAEVTWHWDGFSGAAPQWRVRVAAPGLDLSGIMRAPPPYAEVTLREGRGTADIAVLSAGHLSAPARGDVQIDDLRARFRLSDRRVVRLDGTGQLLGLYYDGVAVGRGPVNLSSDAGGGWRMSFDITGPAVTAQGRVSGLVGAEFVTIDASLVEADAMPGRWRELLDLVADRTEAGAWSVRTRLP